MKSRSLRVAMPAKKSGAKGGDGSSLARPMRDESSSSDSESSSDSDSNPLIASPSKGFLRSPGPLNSSTPKSSKKMDRSIKIERQEKDTENALEGWTNDQMMSLVDQIMENKKKPDNKSWMFSLKKFDWSLVSIEGKTTNDCEKVAMGLVRMVRRNRTLTEVMRDAFDLVTSERFKRDSHPGRPKPPMTPFFMYLNENRARLKKMYPNVRPIDLSKYASQELNSDPSLKDKYKAKYEALMTKYRLSQKKFMESNPELNIKPVRRHRNENPGPIIPRKPRTPFAIYVESKKDGAEPTMQASDRLRSQWDSLNEKKKLKWIKRAVKDVDRYSADLDAYRQQHPDYVGGPLMPRLSPHEQEILGQDCALPMKPPHSGYVIFMNEEVDKMDSKIPIKDRRTTATLKWKEMSTEEKNKYNNRFAQLEMDYLEKVKEYLKSLPQEEQIAFLNQNKIPPLDKYAKNPQTVQVSESSESDDEDPMDRPVKKQKK